MSDFVKLPDSLPEGDYQTLGAVKHKSGVWICKKERVAAWKEQKKREKEASSFPMPQPQPEQPQADTEPAPQPLSMDAPLIQQEDNSLFWDSFTAADSLQYLMALKTQGIPTSAENRTRLLEEFAKRGEGFYPISYEGVCQYCPQFAAVYSQDRMLSLIRRCITGAKPYMTEIAESGLSGEEKALLYFVLPA
jgi:hypothetical protein